MFYLKKHKEKYSANRRVVPILLIISVIFILWILVLRYEDYRNNSTVVLKQIPAEINTDPYKVDGALEKVSAKSTVQPQPTFLKEEEEASLEGEKGTAENITVTQPPASTRLPSPSPQKTRQNTKLEEKSNLNNWLGDKLSPGGHASQEKRTIEAWVGWIFDRDCIGINPVKHTKSCNLMGSCYLSGLGIIPYVKGKPYTTYNSISDYKNFDESSRSVAVAFLESLPADWETNITVKVTGYAVKNIPTNADESEVPETTPSQIDHYLDGIHITSIEAAYIEGISTNKLPSPNIIFPKP